MYPLQFDKMAEGFCGKEKTEGTAKGDLPTYNEADEGH